MWSWFSQYIYIYMSFFFPSKKKNGTKKKQERNIVKCGYTSVVVFIYMLVVWMCGDLKRRG